jgi:AcrR family transcriptional regulator
MVARRTGRDAAETAMTMPLKPQMPLAASLPGEPPERARVTRDPERTSAAILAAAVKEFTDKGYSGARVDAIAERAGINKRMLYHYFGNKEGLYLTVLENAYMAIRSAEAKLNLVSADPVRGMEELARFSWTYFLGHPEFLSLLGTENLLKAATLRRSKRIVELNSPLIRVIGDLIARGAARGDFRADADPLDVYMTIAALGFFYLSNQHTLSTVFGRNLRDEAAVARWGDHIVEVVLRYLRP